MWFSSKNSLLWVNTFIISQFSYTHHTAVAVRIALWSFNGTINGSPSNRLAMKLPPKHNNMLDNHSDKGCFLENNGVPVKQKHNLNNQPDYWCVITDSEEGSLPVQICDWSQDF